MTVRDLILLLEQFDEDDVVCIDTGAINLTEATDAIPCPGYDNMILIV